MEYIKLQKHIVHSSGRSKTVCVTACLTALGVRLDSFHYTGTVQGTQRENILRRSGYCVRSRLSSMPKNPTIGKCRAAINKLQDPPGTRYLVIVDGSGYCHAMLLKSDGSTLVDTDPRKRDKRKVVSVKAVFRK